MSVKYGTGAKIWRVLYPFLVYTLVQGLTEGVAAFGVCLYLLPSYYSSIVSGYGTTQFMTAVLSMTLSLTIPTVALSAIITIPILCWYMKRDTRDRKETGEYVKYSFPNVLKLLVVIVMGLSACFVGNVLLSLLQINQMSSTYSSLSSVMYVMPLSVQIICAGIIGPIAEELVYRGLAYKRLRDSFNVPIAILISSLLFGLAHGNIVQGLYGFAVGILMALVYERFRSIIAPILLHVAANTFSCVLSDERLSGLVSNTRLIMVAFVVFAILLVLSLLFVIFFVHPKKADGGTGTSGGMETDSFY